MADNKTLWTWGNQQKYHEELMQEIEDNTGSSTPVLNTANGNPITVTDGADAPLIELGVYGNSVQDTSSEGVASGKNLLPINASSQTINGITFTVNSDKSITVKGTATNTFYYCVWGKGEYGGVPLEKGTYIVSFGKETFISVSFKKGNQTVGGGGKKADYYEFDFEPSEDTYDTIRVAVQYTLGVTYNETLYPMIRNANIVDDSYEPYIGTPTPEAPIDIVSVGDDRTIEVAACGKNLANARLSIYFNASSYELDANSLSVTSNTGYGCAGATLFTNLIVGKKYTLSLKATGFEYDFADGYVIVFNKTLNTNTGANLDTMWDNQYIIWTAPSGKQQITFTAKTNTVGITLLRSRGGSNTETVTISATDIQLEEGTATEFEQYKGNTAFITSGLPLCSVGDVRDELIYNADGTGKIIKRTAKIVFDGSNDEAWQYSEGNAPFQITISDGSLWESRTELPKLYCNKYQRVPQGATWGSYDYMVSTNTNGTLLAIRDISITTLEEFRAKLNAVPMTVVYVLATPKEIELSAAEITALMQLQTFNGVTNIYNDENADLYIKYWCDNNINTLLNAKASVNHTHTATDVGLGNVENKSSATIRGELTKENVTDALGYTPAETDTTYNAATSSALGLVKIGSNITNTNGTISISKSDVANALGYTPPTSNVATTSTNGLMTSDMVTKLNNLDDISKNIPSKIVCGVYTGDGTESHLIDLGFKPLAVVISAELGQLWCNSHSNTGYIVLDGYAGCKASTTYKRAEIVDNGFKLLDTDINYTNRIYYYIAFASYTL